ncbi:isochorismate synthase [Planobispora longispora]|uniref:isochorismate synthase n=1 Tax=Planobispora longispora TaxID=28887 RepID=A0A8J3RQI0_9ACTN|nr:isochorismate synthase [Planobispora longispora]GIH78895.1 isochorismate synthase DhbC [Planobispora longispora]
MRLLTTAADPLAGYEPGGSVLFSSSRGTLLTRGVRALATGGLATLAERVTALLGEVGGHAGNRLAAGAVGFDGAAHLIVPASATWSGPLEPGAAPSLGGWRVRPVPAPEDYAKAVRLALELMDAEAGEAGNREGAGNGGARIGGSAGNGGAGDPVADPLRKAVLARTLELSRDEPVDVLDLLRPLAGRDMSFAAPLPGGRTLIGASPELLVSRRGRTVISNPLAGSAARSADPAEDRRRAAALAASAKDLHEHRLVVEAVADALAPYCADLDVPNGPELTSTETMWHLSTRVTGVLRDPDTPVLALAAALHPTPAVCGTPRLRARRAIEELEPFDRGFYTGLVGWTDAAGDGEWAVTIRCAEAAGRMLRLYAGAGIVPGSDPDKELAETSAKFRTMLRALGVDTDALA